MISKSNVSLRRESHLANGRKKIAAIFKIYSRQRYRLRENLARNYARKAKMSKSCFSRVWTDQDLRDFRVTVVNGSPTESVQLIINTADAAVVATDTGASVK